MPKHTKSIGPNLFESRTKKGLNEQIDTFLDAFFCTNFKPIVVGTKDADGQVSVAIGWKTEYGNWAYQMHELQAYGRLRPGGTTTGFESREKCEHAMRHHMAQLTFDPADQEKSLELALELLDDEVHDEFLFWAGWQVSYKEAKDRGKSDKEARHEADGLHCKLTHPMNWGKSPVCPAG
jgi:hypothetical protein